MLKGLDENSRDVIEEQCVALFGEKKGGDKDPKTTVVKEKKFK